MQETLIFNQLIEDPRGYPEERNTKPSFSISFNSLADLPVNLPSNVTPRYCPYARETPSRSTFILNEFINTSQFSRAFNLILDPREDTHSYKPAVAAFEVLRNGDAILRNNKDWQNYHEKILCLDQFYAFLSFLNGRHERRSVGKIIKNIKHPLSPNYPIQCIEKYYKKEATKKCKREMTKKLEPKIFEEIYKKFQCLINLGEYEAAQMVIKYNKRRERIYSNALISCALHVQSGSTQNCPHLHNQKNWSCFNTGPVNKASFLKFLLFLNNKKSCKARSIAQWNQHECVYKTLKTLSMPIIEDHHAK
jgi:hypothetical protein